MQDNFKLGGATLRLPHASKEGNKSSRAALEDGIKGRG